jgi:hypothetical protein
MAAVATVASQEVEASKQLTVTWSDCGDSTTHVKVTSVTPGSLTLGSSTKFTGAGNLDQDISDATFSLKVTAALGITVLNCNGDASKAISCKLPAGAGTLSLEPVSFPLKKGALSGIPQVDVNLSANLPASLAKTTVTVSAATSKGDKVFCVQLKTAPASEVAELKAMLQ